MVLHLDQQEDPASSGVRLSSIRGVLVPPTFLPYLELRKDAVGFLTQPQFATIACTAVVIGSFRTPSATPFPSAWPLLTSNLHLIFSHVLDHTLSIGVGLPAELWFVGNTVAKSLRQKKQRLQAQVATCFFLSLRSFTFRFVR